MNNRHNTVCHKCSSIIMIEVKIKDSVHLSKKCQLPSCLCVGSPMDKRRWNVAPDVVSSSLTLHPNVNLAQLVERYVEGVSVVSSNPVVGSINDG